MGEHPQRGEAADRSSRTAEQLSLPLEPPAARSPDDTDREDPYDAWVVVLEPKILARSDRPLLVPMYGGWRKAGLAPRVLDRLTALSKLGIGWPRERRLEELDQGIVSAPPDWVAYVSGHCREERRVPAPSTLDEYARLGVGHVWWVEPDIRRLEVHRLDAKRYTLAFTFTGYGIVRLAPFEDVPVESNAIFGSDD